MFDKAPGIAIEEMLKHTSLYQRLRHFRAGTAAYTWSSLIAANLGMLARQALA